MKSKGSKKEEERIKMYLNRNKLLQKMCNLQFFKF